MSFFFILFIACPRFVTNYLIFQKNNGSPKLFRRVFKAVFFNVLARRGRRFWFCIIIALVLIPLVLKILSVLADIYRLCLAFVLILPGDMQDGQYLRPSDPAYEQVLDSLAMVARHTPVPLLEALLKWRER